MLEPARQVRVGRAPRCACSRNSRAARARRLRAGPAPTSARLLNRISAGSLIKERRAEFGRAQVRCRSSARDTCRRASRCFAPISSRARARQVAALPGRSSRRQVSRPSAWEELIGREHRSERPATGELIGAKHLVLGARSRLYQRSHLGESCAQLTWRNQQSIREVISLAGRPSSHGEMIIGQAPKRCP